MKSKISLIAAILLCLPAISSASVDSNFNATGFYTTGTDSSLEVRLANYQATASLVSVLNISDSSLKDIKSAAFLDKSGWVQLSPFQSGSDVLAKFISDTGFDVGDQRVISLRINFKTPKNYIVGFSLITPANETVSSAAAVLVVSGPKVLGESTPQANTLFTETLTYGSSGVAVTALQNQLSLLGFYSGPVSGFFGRQTQKAVRAYQSSKGIQPNGIVGPATQVSLNQ